MGKSSAYSIQPERREAFIRNAAYFRWAYRGCTPGHEFEDWCAAERELDDLLADRQSRIRKVAYGRWLCSGCTPGHALEDWLAAEHQVESALGRDDICGHE